MAFYWHKTPRWVQWLFPERVWRIGVRPKTLYLTFDDGPTPRVTSWVLQCLAEYEVKATFFCLGRQVEAHPILYKKILREGHCTGNHGYAHLNGWHTPLEDYKRDVQQGERLSGGSKLFRPPYGKLTPSQARWLHARGCKTVLWDVMPGDFDANLSGEQCLDKALRHSACGSIIVLHDSEPAYERLRYLLPRFLERCLSRGFGFERLDQALLLPAVPTETNPNRAYPDA